MPSDGDPKAAASVVVPLQAVADLAARCRAFLTEGLPGAELINAILDGTTTVTGALVGSGGALIISQPGETTHIQGGSTFAAGFTHLFSGPATFAADPTINAGVTLHANGHIVVGVGADEIISGTLSILGTQNVGSLAVLNLQSGGSLVGQSGGLAIFQSGFVAAFNVGTTLNLAGSVINSGVVRNSGGGHCNIRSLFGLDANQHLSIALADHFGVQPTAPRDYTLDNTGCVGGEVITIFNEFAPSHAARLFGKDGTTLLLTLDNGPYTGVELVNDGADTVVSWHVRQTSRG